MTYYLGRKKIPKKIETKKWNFFLNNILKNIGVERGQSTQTIGHDDLQLHAYTKTDSFWKAASPQFPSQLYRLHTPSNRSTAWDCLFMLIL